MLDCPLVDTTCDSQMQIKALELTNFKSEFEQIHIKIPNSETLNLTWIIDDDRLSCDRYFTEYVESYIDF